MNPFAALYDFYVGVPAPIREPVRSAVVSIGLGLIAIVPTFFTGYFFNPELHGQTWGGFFHLMTTPAFAGAVFAAIAAAYRARQGFRAATQTVSTSAAVSVPQPPPPAKIVAIGTTVMTPPDSVKAPPAAP